MHFYANLDIHTVRTTAVVDSMCAMSSNDNLMLIYNVHSVEEISDVVQCLNFVCFYLTFATVVPDINAHNIVVVFDI